MLSSYIELNYTHFGSHVIEVTHPANINFCTKHQSYYVHTSVSDKSTVPPPLFRALHEDPKFAPLVQNLAIIYEPVFIPVLKKPVGHIVSVVSGQVWSVLGFRLVSKVFLQGGTMLPYALSSVRLDPPVMGDRQGGRQVMVCGLQVGILYLRCCRIVWQITDDVIIILHVYY